MELGHKLRTLSTSLRGVSVGVGGKKGLLMAAKNTSVPSLAEGAVAVNQSHGLRAYLVVALGKLERS